MTCNNRTSTACKSEKFFAPISAIWKILLIGAIGVQTIISCSSDGGGGNDTGGDAWALLEDTAWLKTGETYLSIKFLNPYGSFKDPVFNARKSSGNEFTETFKSFSKSKVVLYSKGSFNYSISGDSLTISNSKIEDYDLDGVYLKQAI